MQKKWLLKVATLITATALVMTACGTSNNNQQTPKNDPELPANENMNYDIDHNENIESPARDVNDNQSEERNINNNSSRDIPNKMGPHNIKKKETKKDKEKMPVEE